MLSDWRFIADLLFSLFSTDWMIALDSIASLTPAASIGHPILESRLPICRAVAANEAAVANLLKTKNRTITHIKNRHTLSLWLSGMVANETDRVGKSNWIIIQKLS